MAQSLYINWHYTDISCLDEQSGLRIALWIDNGPWRARYLDFAVDKKGYRELDGQGQIAI